MRVHLSIRATRRWATSHSTPWAQARGLRIMAMLLFSLQGSRASVMPSCASPFHCVNPTWVRLLWVKKEFISWPESCCYPGWKLAILLYIASLLDSDTLKSKPSVQSYFNLALCLLLQADLYYLALSLLLQTDLSQIFALFQHQSSLATHSQVGMSDSTTCGAVSAYPAAPVFECQNQPLELEHPETSPSSPFTFECNMYPIATRRQRGGLATMAMIEAGGLNSHGAGTHSYYCCHCKQGPSTYNMNPKCPSCGHEVCKECVSAGKVMITYHCQDSNKKFKNLWKYLNTHPLSLSPLSGSILTMVNLGTL